MPAIGAFVVLWVVVSMLLSRLSGWRSLTQPYPAAATPDGTSLWTGLVLGRVAYRGVVKLTAGSSYLQRRPPPSRQSRAPGATR